MRVVHASDRAEESAAVGVGGMRIVFVIGVLMMFAMDRDPLEDRAFEGHGSHDRQRRSDPSWCFETLMREESVISDRDPKPRCKVHPNQDCKVDPVERDSPQKHDRQDQADEWESDSCDVDQTQFERDFLFTMMVVMMMSIVVDLSWIVVLCRRKACVFSHE